MMSEFIRSYLPLQQFASSRALFRFGHLGSVRSQWLPTREEFGRLPPAQRYLILGLTGLVGLVGALTLSGVIAVELSISDLPWLDRGGATNRSIQNNSEKTYEHITARPVFARVRQAQIVVADAPLPVAPAAAPLDQNMVLKGVFISGSSAKAFLTTSQNPVGSWVKLNGDFLGWKLVEVKPEQAILEGQGEKLVVKLSVTAK